ncbi:MAG: hypothetical protein R3B64_00940 [Candidatus Paceibacterota bacterium]|nr:hypothetical protein [Candidatus Nomurabacteria bacterium]
MNIYRYTLRLFSEVKDNGSLLLGVAIFAGVAITTMTAFIGWAVALSNINESIYNKTQSRQIAEAGIEYYRWHLAHDPDDFQDGTGEEGPYVHDYYDTFDLKVGEFSLDITPPGGGSEVLYIESTGTLDSSPEDTITIRIGLTSTSLAQWAIVSNSDLYIPSNTVILGAIHSNQGVRVDGYVKNSATSALTDYDDPLHTGDNEHAVHTHVKPPPLTGTYANFVPAEAPPSSIATRSDVFAAGREVGVAAIDFVGITQDLAEIKTAAQASGNYYPASGYQGYHVVLNTDGTYDLYTVLLQQNIGGGCADPDAPPNDPDWGGWTIKLSGGESYIGNYSFPADGKLFFEDHVWVDGTIDGDRITIAAGILPDSEPNRKHIIINHDLKYTNYDGTDAIGLIAQDDILIGLVSDDTMEIDAAMVAQNGGVSRMHYNNGSTACSTYRQRASLEVYGMIASNENYAFYYPATSGGYQVVEVNYDANLLMDPPPGFPEASSEYQVVSWEEI